MAFGFLGSCFGACIASCGISAVGKLCCAKNTRIPYFIFFFLTAIVATILRYWSSLTANLFTLPITICDSSRCIGFGAVYRMMASMTVFFLLMAGLMLMSRHSKSIDTGYWPIKLIVFIAVIVGFWFIPNDFYQVYSNIARLAGGIFLFLQIIILLDWIFSVHEVWLERGWKMLILVASIICIGGSITLYVFTAKYYFLEGCSEQKFIGIASMVLGSIGVLLSISGLSTHGLLPGTLIMLYGAYSAYIALSSGPLECKAFIMNDTLSVIVGVLLTIASVVYSSWSLSSAASVGASKNEDEDEDGEERLNENDEVGYKSSKPTSSTPLSPQASESSAGYNGKNPKYVVNMPPHEYSVEDEDAQVDAQLEAQKVYSKNATYFHLILALASCYFAMLLTAWGSVSSVEEETRPIDVNPFSMWVKVVALFLTYGFYMFTFFAPMFFPDREFS